MKLFLSIIFLIPLLIWSTLRIVNGISFDRNCEGYLKRAADANTIERAAKELDHAIKYMQGNNLTTGYTSVLYTTPDEDIEFWYNNINSAKEELEKVTDETTQLERSNILMKLRETLLDNNSNGTSVTVPIGISIYPNNVPYAWFGWISILMFLGGIVILFLIIDEW